ncbi:thioesterase II family protein [Streptomyces atratus]|uniref:thioesterase II family protein n=1 Tax=Streptomyces atratus TaxID=1893 RepID=UPI00225A6D27|nr:thioesterase domain-containing protein [Streptomyces atratus]MCX5345238.1 alpha/beta fold hydrolase [Streptomyces atratus]
MTHTAVFRGSAVCPSPVADPSLRLFLFHHAGGSHLLYRDWAPEFPPDWELCLLNAPGRAHRRDQPAVDRVEDLVDHFHQELLPLFDRPFAFFGHSMGGLAAYELTLRLAAQGGPMPVWLGLSAFGPPRGAEYRRRPGRHESSDAELRDWLRSLGGTPAELLDNDDVWQLFEPVFRSDFKLVDTWARDPATGSPPLPFTVFGGEQDLVVEPRRLKAWADHSPHLQGVHLYPGGHFYLHDHRAALIRTVTASVRAARAAAERIITAPGAS